MHEETFAELLRSPLDEDIPPRQRSWLLPLVAGVAVGALLGWAWVASRAAEETVVTATTTSVGEAPVAAVPFPAGFLRVSETAAMRPEALYAVRDATVVVITTVAAAGTPPDRSPVPPGGVWELRDVEGRVIDGYEEIRNPASLGTVAVRFPGADAQVRSLALTPLTEPEVITASVPIEIPQFPFTTGRSFEMPLASDLRLSGVLTSLDAEGGDVRWSLQGADALAQVDLAITLPGTEGEDGAVTTMLSEHIAPPYPFQRQRAPRPSPLASGTDVVRRTGPEIDDPTTVTRAVIDVTVSVYRTRDDAVVEFDLAPLTG
ncbi:MAG TPA: hypothetical protein VLG28_00175 [Acidimicrobiia bacterium]|jgi:hypothetical protein|nr:hypothetical protein [Acidimicrobiia bacterium]